MYHWSGYVLHFRRSARWSRKCVPAWSLPMPFTACGYTHPWHLSHSTSSNVLSPVSPLWRGHPAITYLFQPLCLPQRLFVTILILTSDVLLVRVCLHFRRSIRWSRKCVPTWSGSSTSIPWHCTIFKLLFIYIYYMKSMRNVELSKLTVWDNELTLDENFLGMGVKTYLF